MLRSPDTRRQEASAAFGFWCRRARLEAWPRATPPRCPGWAGGWPSIWPRQCARPVCPHPGHRPAGGGTPTWCACPAGGWRGAPLLAALRRVLERPEHAAVRARTSLITYGGTMPSRRTTAPAATPDRVGRRRHGGGGAGMPMPPTPWSCASPTAGRWRCSASGPSPPSRRRSGALAHRFYNDTYQMDQNACSSPSWCCGWRRGSPACRGRWWEAVAARRRARPSAPSRRPASWAAVPLRHDPWRSPPSPPWGRYQGTLYVARLAGAVGSLLSLAGGFGWLFFEAAPAQPGALPPCSRPRRSPGVAAGWSQSGDSRPAGPAGAQGVAGKWCPGRSPGDGHGLGREDQIAAPVRIIG